MLETGEGVICTLLKLDENNLVGLSSQGELIGWTLPDAEIVKSVALLPPPILRALVHMAYWPAAHSMVFPGRGGILVLYDLETGEVRTQAAHEGDFYALFILNDDLATMGMKDCRFKLWKAESLDEPFMEFKVPTGVVSARNAGVDQDKIVLVTENGEAGIYSLENSALRFINKLTGSDYRAIWGPNSQEFEELRFRERASRVEQLIYEIQEKIEHNNADGIEELHCELKGLGYEQISMALLANQAFRNEDIISELKIRSELVRLLPRDNPDSFDSFERYASILEKIWQIEEAYDIYAQILTINPDHKAWVLTSPVSRS